MLLREMFGRRRDRLQMMGSSGGDRGRKSRRFLTNCKLQITNYKLQIANHKFTNELKPLSLFISILLMLKKALDNVKIGNKK